MKQLFIEYKAIFISSSTHPRGISLNDITPIRWPVECVVRPRGYCAEKIAKVVCAVHRSVPFRFRIVTHDKIFMHATDEIFAYLGEIVGGDIIVLSCCQGFLLEPHFPFIIPCDLSVDAICGTCGVCASLVSA